MDTNYCNYNGKNETFNWKHSIYEFINCFPDAKTGSEAVNSFKKQITINGRIYNWYELFNLIRVPGDGSQQIQFFLNSCFTYGGARSVTENCEFLYLP
jgi:predicted outer membrane repeat protein